ncbi:hypothetical protein M378DRAFT_17798 [Amanita muscaria Koide BX008]|uniref:Uncharacterized protein n=1 Tax=Amanita muscaria (strain Koide BX008) TaxID=946122 RepID=A0A0C2W3C2_AMAMK|nr:hypothetical protein M378DRAFT_17798 [Amanita muscaria Koide BX008]
MKSESLSLSSLVSTDEAGTIDLFASVTERFPQPDYLRSILLVLEFTISCLFLSIPYFFIGRSRGHIVDEEDGSRSVAPCLRHADISCVWGASSIPFLSGLDSFARIAGFVAIIPVARWMSSNFLATKFGEITSRRRWRRASSALETKRGRVSILRIVGFVAGVMLHTLEGASVMDAGLVRQPFDKYTHWTTTGAIGAKDCPAIPGSSGRCRLPKACTLGKRQPTCVPTTRLLPSASLDQSSPSRRCPCPVRLEEHVTEGSELRCPEARRQESSPPMLSTDDGLSGASKVALLVNGTGTAKLPLPPTSNSSRGGGYRRITIMSTCATKAYIYW